MRDRVQQQRARAMRSELAESENRLWQHLRRRQIAGFRFRRQHPIGPYIADFASIDGRLVIEVDGDVHGSEAHAEADARRTAYLRRSGWRVLRFWTSQLVSGEIGNVVDAIRRELDPSFEPAA